MTNIEKMLVAAHSIRQQYDGFLLRATVPDSDRERAASHLCMTIAEQFAATLCLIENGFSSHSPIIIRSMIEGLADLTILMEDASHLDQMAYESTRSNAAIFEKAAANPKRRSDAIPAAVIKAAATAASVERDQLKDKGFRPQKMEDKLEKAGLGMSFVSYKMLCGFAHNDLMTLETRHRGTHPRHHYEAPPSVTIGMLNVAFSLFTEAIALLPSFSDTNLDELLAVRYEMDGTWQNCVA